MLIHLFTCVHCANGCALVANSGHDYEVRVHIDRGASRHIISDVRPYASCAEDVPNVTNVCTQAKMRKPAFPPRDHSYMEGQVTPFDVVYSGIIGPLMKSVCGSKYDMRSLP